MQFALIAHQRTGTTMFRTMLNCNPSIFLYGEILYPDYFHWGFFSYLVQKAKDDSSLLLPPNWIKLLQPYCSELTSVMQEAKKEHVGFDLKIPQLNGFCDMHKFLFQNDFGVIHLKRINVVECVVSQEIMKKRISGGLPVHSVTKLPPLKLSVDKNWLAAMIHEIEYEDNKIKFSYNTKRYLELVYEELVDDRFRPKVEENLSNFFEIPVRLGQPAYEKQGGDIRETIENYRELTDLIDPYYDRVLAHR